MTFRRETSIASKLANAQLTEREVRLIRAALARGAKPKALAELYGTGVETIRRIGRRETWAWVTDEFRPEEAEATAELALPPKTEETEAAAAASLARLQELLKKP